MNPILIKTFDASGTINPYRLVKFGASDSLVVQAAASTDRSFGVSDGLGAASGGRVDVALMGIAEVTYGGTIARGQKLTSDANGKVVVAAPAEGVLAEVAGIAMVSGAEDEVGLILLGASTYTGV